jgi:hypothetical protein
MSRHTTQAGPGSEFFLRRVRSGRLVAPESLVAWYPFRQGDGSDATAGISAFGDSTDYSATVNGATFKPNGGVTDIATGANSGAFDLDGTDDTLDLGTVADSNQSLTIMGWVKPDVVNVSTAQRLITKADGLNFQDGSIILDILGDASPRLVFILNGTPNVAKSPTTISPNQYVHLAGRYDFGSGEISLFINGQTVATTFAGQAPSLSTQPWRLGEDNPVGNKDELLDGTTDGTRIYTAALSDSQINQIYLNTEP